MIIMILGQYSNYRTWDITVRRCDDSCPTLLYRTVLHYVHCSIRHCSVTLLYCTEQGIVSCKKAALQQCGLTAIQQSSNPAKQHFSTAMKQMSSGSILYVHVHTAIMSSGQSPTQKAYFLLFVAVLCTVDTVIILFTKTFSFHQFCYGAILLTH